MEDYKPLFPLGLVLFPGEPLNLHIFEPRYKQLIAECVEDNKPFIIPPFFNESIKPLATSARVLSVEKVYEDGRMDIKTVGERIWLLTDMVNPLPEKLYAGGLGTERETIDIENPALRKNLLRHVEKLYQYLPGEPDPRMYDAQPLSWFLGHRVTLSVEDEYRMLGMTQETDRQAFLFHHISRALPLLRDLERTKARIQMNGHFREFDPLSF